MSSSSSDTFHSCNSQLDENCITECKEKSNSSKLSDDDFELLHLVGRGSFGKVFQVRKKNGKDINKIYAMKVVDKKNIIKQGVICRYTERKYLCGGELRVILRNHGVLSEDAASFYIKEIILALEYLHLQRIIYRDLKPTNILLDIQGHVKMIDFGLSKENIADGKLSYTLCGSAAYVAPEVVSLEGHGAPADWWSLGVLFYVMVVGKKPFQTTRQTLTKVDYTKYLIPENLTCEAKSLIVGLLQVDQKVRLGSSGDNKIKEHRFFKGTCWDKVFHRKELPPFWPQSQDESDVSQFDSSLTNLTTNIFSMKSTFDGDNSLYKHFNYVRPSLLE